MSSPAVPDAEAPGNAAERSARRRLTRSITVTWWYTASAVLMFELALVFVWSTGILGLGRGGAAALAVAVGGLVWVGSTVPLLLEYRRKAETSWWSSWKAILAPLVVAVAFGVLAGVLSGAWVIGVLPVAQSVVLLAWPSGVRLRLVIALTVVLIALWFVDSRTLHATDSYSTWWLLGFFAVVVPTSTVLSLWWWDVLMTLDRARASEARLAATQERLRVATDVHDLQGHHLQVIALQLELAERLMPADPTAGMEQLRAARRSVDDARQGTRDLATRFRSVPLRDELANAVDLLRAAGISAESAVDAGADGAPASVLAPIIRETTSNALRHGGGRWARLSLVRENGMWRYEMSNDTAETPDPSVGGGAGLEGIERRVAEVGGTLEAHRDRGEFGVIVTVPEGVSA